MQWSRWLDDLPQLKSYVDRCLKSKDFISVKSVQLHSVSYGSRVGYAAVDHLHFFNADRINCSIVMGKTRLAPIYEITKPRKAEPAIQEELETRIDQVDKNELIQNCPEMQQ